MGKAKSSYYYKSCLQICLALPCIRKFGCSINISGKTSLGRTTYRSPIWRTPQLLLPLLLRNAATGRPSRALGQVLFVRVCQPGLRITPARGGALPTLEDPFRFFLLPGPHSGATPSDGRLALAHVPNAQRHSN